MTIGKFTFFLYFLVPFSLSSHHLHQLFSALGQYLCLSLSFVISELWYNTAMIDLFMSSTLSAFCLLAYHNDFEGYLYPCQSAFLFQQLFSTRQYSTFQYLSQNATLCSHSLLHMANVFSFFYHNSVPIRLGINNFR